MDLFKIVKINWQPVSDTEFIFKFNHAKKKYILSTKIVVHNNRKVRVFILRESMRLKEPFQFYSKPGILGINNLTTSRLEWMWSQYELTDTASLG